MSQSKLLGFERPNDGGQVRAVGPVDSFEPAKPLGGRTRVSTPEGVGDEVPIVILVGTWVYITGVNPVVGTEDAVAGASGSSMIVQKDGTTTRAILLESWGDGFVQKPDGSGRVTFSEGNYVQIDSGVIGVPQPFSSTAFTGAADLLTEVDIARQHWNVP